MALKAGVTSVEELCVLMKERREISVFLWSVDGRKRRGGGGGSGGGAMRRSGASGGSQRASRELYAHAHECVTLLAELFAAHNLTDTTVLHASTVGVSPFFVENVSELQLSALKLVTTVRVFCDVASVRFAYHFMLYCPPWF